MDAKINDDLTYRIIGCAMKVHNNLGNGFQACLPKGSTACRQEVMYQRCLAIELDRASIEYAREMEMPIFYENIEVGTRRADFIVAGEVMVELKALVKLEDVHLAQALNYSTAYRIDKGLLINFGSASLEV